MSGGYQYNGSRSGLTTARDILEASTDNGGAEDRSTPKADSEQTTTVAKDPLASSLFSMAALMRPSVTSSSASKTSSVASVTSSLSPGGGMGHHSGLLPPPPPGLSASALLANLNSSLQLG